MCVFSVSVYTHSQITCFISSFALHIGQHNTFINGHAQTHFLVLTV